MKIGVYSFEEGKEPKDLEKEIKKLKKQLKVAVKCLKSYANPNNWSDFTGVSEEDGQHFKFINGYYEEDGFSYAQVTLADIRNLDK